MVRSLGQLALLGLAGLPAALADAQGFPADVTCADKASDQTVYTGASGAAYQIMCGVDYAGHDLPATTAATFAECIDACDATARCVDVSYSGQSCYLKSKATTAITDRDRVWTARLITTNVQLDCEDNVSDNVEYTTSKNGVYQIMCGVDYGGGDILGTNAETFEDCIAACDDNADCIDVSYVAPSCYLKKTIGNADQRGHVWTAKQLVAPHTIPVDDGLKCPQSDNSEYTDEQGNAWLIQCGVDYMYYDTGETHAESMSDCISWCDGRASGSCVSLTWLDDAPADQTNCWAHSQPGVARYSQWHSMLRVSPPEKRAVRRARW